MNSKTTMNHAAEQAVAQAKPVFKQALQHMTLSDAKGILTGGDGAGTAYFKRTPPAPSSHQPTSSPSSGSEDCQARRHGQVQRDRGQSGAAGTGVVPGSQHFNDYVTGKALDGLFSRVAEEEHEIRKNPMGQASSLIKKVFGAL